MVNLNDVLLAMSNIPVDDPIAEIWGRGLQSGYKIIEYTGSLPITINADGDTLLDYRIYGADGGVGEQTENLFDGEMESGYYDNSGEKQSNQNWIRCKNFIRVNQNKTYHAVIVNNVGAIGSVVFARCYNARKEYIGTTTQSTIEYYKEYAFETLSDTEYVTFYISNTYSGLKIALFETVARKPYIPYGYKLPMVTRSENLYNKNDPDIVYSAYMNYAGTIIQGSYGDAVKVSGYIPINGGQTYTGTNLMNSGAGNYYAYYDTNKQLLGTGLAANNMVFNSPTNAAYIRTTLVHRLSEDIAMLTEGSTAPSSYIPYAKTTTPVYIGENKLEENEYVSYGEQKIYRDVSGTLTPTDPPVPLPDIPTIKGETVIDYDGEPKPSQMYVKYKSKG